MVYYCVTVYEGEDEPEICRVRTKNDVIEWLMMGINPDWEGVFRTLREAKEFIGERIPNYKFRRIHYTDMLAGSSGWD